MRRALVVALGLAVSMVGFAAPAAAEEGDQTFIVLLTGVGEEETARVIAFGPITGVGTFEEDPDENLVHFHFDDGSVTLFAPSDEESEEFDEESCSGSFTFSGHWEIIGGTGAYEDATGSGTFEGKGDFFGVPGACEEEAGFFFLIVDAEGTVDVSGAAAA